MKNQNCDPTHRLYSTRRHWERHRTPFVTEGESMTINSFKDETDINNIVGRYHRTGELPNAKIQPQYADVSGLQGDITETLARAETAAQELGDIQAKAAKANEAKKAAPKQQTAQPEVNAPESQSKEP